MTIRYIYQPRQIDLVITMYLCKESNNRSQDSSKYTTSMIDFCSTGLQQNQTVEYEAEIFSFNSRGRSEVLRLPKITLNAEEIVAALSSHNARK